MARSHGVLITQHGCLRAAIALGIVCLCGVAIPSRADAWEGKTKWPTYLHAGADKQDAVIDELEAGTTVDVLDCGKQWCRVVAGRAIGYIESDLVLKPDAQLPSDAPQLKASTSQACIDARRVGYQNGQVYQFCGE